MPKSRTPVALLASLVALGFARGARAEEVDVGGKPLEIDVTNTAIGNYHFNNHNDIKYTPITKVDDDYLEFLDKFNLQLSWWRFQAGLRVDSYVAQRPSDDRITELVAQDYGPAQTRQRQQLTNNYAAELNTRFLPTAYPTKLFVGYQQPSVEVTVGDFYVQLGRGLVFSVRKIDELSIDTTVRGAKAAFDRSFGGVHLGAIAFAGQMNPVRLDETTGRRLNILPNEPLFFGFPTGQDLTVTEYNQIGAAITDNQVARPNYLEDTVFGGKIEGGSKFFTLGANAALLDRQNYDAQNAACKSAGHDTAGAGTTITKGLCDQQFPTFAQNDPSREANKIENFSGSLSLPNLADHGDLYVEVVGQKLDDKKGGAPSSSGYAVYVAASARGGPVTLSLEGKHYRSFFPLPANVDTTTNGFGAPEFNNVFYSQPPTAQSIYIEPVAGANPELCVTGGRGVLNYRFNPSTALFTWLGRFADWSEVNALNYPCAPSTGGLSNETDTWDYAAGMEMFLEHGKSKANFYAGAIENTLVDPHSTAVSGTIGTFYREGYIRYDLVKHIKGPFSIQAQGWHRRRYEPTSLKTPWWEGENYTALQWSPHFSAIFGFEYLVKDGCETGSPPDLNGNPPGVPGVYGKAKNTCYFYNGGLQWRAAGAGGVAGQIFDTVNVFVGERRGGLRCVSGVCRTFPPFSGAKIELVSRF